MEPFACMPLIRDFPDFGAFADAAEGAEEEAWLSPWLGTMLSQLGGWIGHWDSLQDVVSFEYFFKVEQKLCKGWFNMISYW